jgi:hypothetical protein
MEKNDPLIELFRILNLPENYDTFFPIPCYLTNSWQVVADDCT